MTKKTVPIQGSGWGWLAYDSVAKCLRLLDLPNQEMLAPLGLVPLLSKFNFIQQLMYGNMPIMLITKTLDQITLSKYGKLLTGKTLKKDSKMQQLKNRKNKNDLYKVSVLQYNI